MNERSLRVLEWDKIKQKVAEKASFTLGKELVMQLEPVNDFDEVQRRLRLTSAALEQLWKYNDPPFGGAANIFPVLERAAIGGLLDGEELLQVSGLLYCASQMRRYLAKSAAFEDYLVQIVDSPELLKELNRCLDDEGQLKDNASPDLAKIRRQMRNLAGKVREKLENIVSSSSYQKMLQDNIITLRNGRYVVPVKQEYRSQFSGIIHDQSGSGATVFMEPSAVVELNNQLRLVEQEEQREIQRILRELSRAVEQQVPQLKQSLHILAELDLIFAMAKYSKSIDGTEPRLNQEGKVRIKQGRHPLLTGKVVPIDLWLGDEFYMLIITGPNTGGKTVTLKTLGLFAIMTQAGLHIPAQAGSEMPVFDQILADIGDEQSIEQSLSTFSSHMINIVNIVEQATSRSLVLLDELGAGTDPTEGAALATALLEHFRIKAVTTVATTHYSELKNYAYAHPEIENASVEFDLATLKPTYHLSIGVPGKSNAFAIAQRLGLPKTIVDLARSQLTDEHLKVDDIINEIEQNQRETRLARLEAEELRNQLAVEKARYEKLSQKLTAQREQLLEQARREAEQLVKNTKQELDLLIGELRRQQNIDLEKIVQEKREQLIQQQEALKAKKSGKPAAPKLTGLKAGEEVRIKSLNQAGYVLEVSDEEALIQAGIMKVNVKLTDLVRVNQPQQVTVQRHTGRSRVGVGKSNTIRPELDLRGFTVEEATLSVDKYLDDAFLSSLEQVRIIHGKGTGALREAIQDQLAAHPHVKSFRLGDPSEGGSGVTTVTLVK